MTDPRPDHLQTNAEKGLGLRLYELLPELYRYQDDAGGAATQTDEGDLKLFLAGFGDVLDRLRNTLEQRLEDSFPDNPALGEPCQDWLLPYFARLLDTTLVSPHASGRRAELADSIWLKKRKGSKRAADRIVEDIIRLPAVLHEGWRRVALTPQTDRRHLKAEAFGEKEADFRSDFRRMSHHPRFPNVTIDFRQAARVVAVTPGSPGGERQAIPLVYPKWPRGEADENGEIIEPPIQTRETAFREVNRHGVPCFQDSFEDLSRRIVDMRDVGHERGYYHPNRVIIFVPPQPGFFSPADQTLEAHQLGQGLEHKGPELIEVTGNLAKTSQGERRYSRLRFDGKITVTEGRLVLRRVAIRNLHMLVTQGQPPPVLDARDCLFGELHLEGAEARLEYCTVLGEMEASGSLEASDCIFAGSFKRPPDPTDVLLDQELSACVRYSRADQKFLDLPDNPGQLEAKVNLYRTTSAKPIFQSGKFGDWGAGVLSQAAPEAISSGAEDGGEMGAYHAWRYAAELAAVKAKIKDFLPVGIEAVVVSDQRVFCFMKKALKKFTEEEDNV